MSTWDAATAEWYAEKYGEYPTNRLGLDGIALPANACVVDVGCGTGTALRWASAQVTAGRLIGVDPVPRMIELAQAATATHPAADRIEYRVGPASALPVDDGCADWVLAFDSFHHWTDPATGLAEIRRILAPAGRWIVVKDGGLPTDRAQFEATVEAAGWAIIQVDELSGDGARCLRWVLR